MPRFLNSRVVVTGAAQGIGRAVAHAFTAEGARVWALDLDAGALAMADAVQRRALDLSRRTEVHRVMAEVAAAEGGIDILVCCAGGVRGQVGRPLVEITEADWHVIFQANLESTLWCAQAAAPIMQKAGHGRIVTIASGAGLRPSLTGIQAYTSAKHALVGLTKQLSFEFARHGITANSVAPGFIRSNPTTEAQWDSYGPEGQAKLLEGIHRRRPGKPEDIANAVLFFADPASDWVSGQILSRRWRAVVMRIVPFALLAAALAFPALGQTLRIGLGADPNVLDPARSGSFVERVVFTALCDRLLDVAPDLSFRPELATAWAWEDEGRTLRLTLRTDGRFHDGTPLDAAAVKVNLDRYRSAPESVRRSELRPVTEVEAPDPRTVLIRLSQAYAPLLSVLSDRSGMIMSPTALARLGARIGEEPVCSGPFRLTRRIPQDRIEMERVPGHWNAANIHVERIIMRPMPDSTVRLLNLRSGQLDLIERIAPSDVASARRDSRVMIAERTSIAYQAIYFNTATGALRDPRLREAFELSIDRAVINRVALEGLFVPSNQPEAPGAPFHFASIPVPGRDVARARALLREAGQPNPVFTLLTPNSPVETQVSEVMQSMAAEAGFQMRIETLESAAMVARAESGRYDVSFGIWSGRADPDGNIALWIASDGFLNRMGYRNAEVDAAFIAARQSTDAARRRGLYEGAARQWMADRPMLILYHYRWFWGLRARMTGFEPAPDGLIRFSGLRLPPG